MHNLPGYNERILSEIYDCNYHLGECSLRIHIPSVWLTKAPHLVSNLCTYIKKKYSNKLHTFHQTNKDDPSEQSVSLQHIQRFMNMQLLFSFQVAR